MSSDTSGPRSGAAGTPPASPKPQRETFWSAYWERFRRQQVDDPVEDQREGPWERFRRQQVDDPVHERRGARAGPEG